MLTSFFFFFKEGPQNYSSRILIVSGLAEKPFGPESSLLNQPALQWRLSPGKVNSASVAYLDTPT